MVEAQYQYQHAEEKIVSTEKWNPVIQPATCDIPAWAIQDYILFEVNVCFSLLKQVSELFMILHLQSTSLNNTGYTTFLPLQLTIP